MKQSNLKRIALIHDSIRIPVVNHFMSVFRVVSLTDMIFLYVNHFSNYQRKMQFEFVHKIECNFQPRKIAFIVLWLIVCVDNACKYCKNDRQYLSVSISACYTYIHYNNSSTHKTHGKIRTGKINGRV